MKDPKDFNTEQVRLADPASRAVLIPALSDVVYPAKGRPRAFRADSTGLVVVKGIDGISVPFNVLQGETIAFRISEIVDTTTVDIQVFW